MSRKNSQGFTLVELMTVIVVAGVLAGIAYPSYQGSVRRGNAAEAQAALQAVASEAETYYLARSSYVGFTIRANLASTPQGRPSRLYNLAASNLTATTYTITATPTTTGMNKTMGKMAIESDGRKLWDYNNDGDYTDTGEQAWRK